MFSLSLSVNNPFFVDKPSRIDHIFQIGGDLSKNKSFEMELTLDKSAPYNLFNFSIDFSIKGKDHAGFYLDIGVVNLEFSLHLYDIRHWNFKENSWNKYND